MVLPILEKIDVQQESKVVGVDFNKGFVALSEVKEDGNLINTDKIYYRFKKGDGSINDLRVLADTLVKRCISKNASLAIDEA